MCVATYVYHNSHNRQSILLWGVKHNSWDDLYHNMFAKENIVEAFDVPEREIFEIFTHIYMYVNLYN